MTLGYSVGALHTIQYSNPAAFETVPQVDDQSTSMLARRYGVTIRRSIPGVPPTLKLSVSDIFPWRDRFNATHLDVLGKPGRGEHFLKSEDYANHGDDLLRYVARVFALGAEAAALQVASHDYASLSEIFTRVRDLPASPLSCR